MNYSLQTIKGIMLLICMLLSPTIVRCAPFVYVANTKSSSVSVIDATTNSVITTIDLGANQPTSAVTGQIAITPDGKTVYVPCYDGYTGTVQRIDVATNTLLSEIVVGSGDTPSSIAITPNGLYGYVAYSNNSYGTFIAKINIATNVIEDTTFLGNGTDLAFLAIAPNGLTAYIVVPQTIIVFDLTDDTVAESIDVVYDGVGQPIVSPDNTYLYVGIETTGIIQQYNLAARLNPMFIQDIEYPSIPQFHPIGLIITSDGKTMYVSSVSDPIDNYIKGYIGTIDISNPLSPITGTVVDTGLDGALLMALSSDNNSLYLTSYPFGVDIGAPTTGFVGVLDTSNPFNPTFKTAIEVGDSPFGIVITPFNSAPTNVSGCKTKNAFLFQTDYINKLTWAAPAGGTTVTSYNIYRDAALTDLAGSSSSLEFYDHNRNPNITYSYYITSVDGSGTQSTSASVTVTQNC